jgi:protein phosphatase
MNTDARPIPSRELEVPELSLVVLVGASGSGKSTFAANRFLPTEVLSSDFCRSLVADDENDQSATNDAFEILHFIAAKRLAAGRLTVIDATNVKREDRAKLVRLAREHHFLPVAIVFDLPERVSQDRNRNRPDRDFGPHVIRNQIRELRRGLRGMRKEGFRQVHVLDSPEAIEAATITRTRLWNNRTGEHGPFDIIGDVHGCYDELELLLVELGYQITEHREGEFPNGGPVYAHPEGRAAVFVGDLVDRGPGSSTPSVWFATWSRRAPHNAYRATTTSSSSASSAAATFRSRTGSTDRSPSSERFQTIAASRPPLRWCASSTPSSATTCTTTASWWSPTQG